MSRGDIAKRPAAIAEEDNLSARDYAKLAEVIGRETGVKLPPNKRSMVESRLRKHLRDWDFDTFDEYCAYLFQSGGLEQELASLIDLVTTHTTDFFREPDHFDLIEKRLVADILANRRAGGSPVLKFWSAASSTGAEAYTMAMVLAEVARERRDFRFVVLGTDISTGVIAHAQKAIYPIDMITPIPAKLREKYVMHASDGKNRTQFRIAPEIRKQVRFAALNLMDPSYPIDKDVDVIFLRNVLIYFDRADQEAVIQRLVGHLRPSGYLFLGHSESMIGAGDSMVQIAPAVFQKS